MAFNKAKALQSAEKSVAQGKIPQAVKQYQDILDKDPSDVSLLNTLGDLYIRERNITEGLRQFHKLAEAYVREGFNVKAIAIYRKISKVDPHVLDTLLKLAELYQLQGLSREAREQYLQAAEAFKKRHQPDRALEALRKLVHLDPENINFRNRLATECEQLGKREEAGQSYLESAEILIRRGDQAAAEPALKKAAELDPDNSKIQLLRARVAIACQQPEEAERIINSAADLQLDPAGRRILLEAYLGARKLPQAENLAREAFHANPTDFTPIASLSALLVEKGDIDGAYQLLASLAEPLINQNNVGALLEALRGIWTAAPDHLPTLELIHRLCERTANESTLPEVLEALGRVHRQAGDMEKAEAAYLKLVEREPENENYHALLNAVQQKLGRAVKPVEFASKEMALAAAEDEPAPGPAGVDADQEVMVKEALENSDLFTRYNLPEKAISELEKVLQVYPNQIDVHRRILEISRKGYPERGAEAAAQLARIFAELGDVETADKYQAIASTKGPLLEIPLPPAPQGTVEPEPASPLPAVHEGPGVETAVELPNPALVPEEPPTASPAPMSGVPFDLRPPADQGEPPVAPPESQVLAEPPLELDLTGEIEALKAFVPEPSTPLASEPVATPAMEASPVEIPVSAEEPTQPVVDRVEPHVEAPAAIPEPPPSPGEAISSALEEGKIEVEFYLENGFVEEARLALADLEVKCPGDPVVTELRKQFDERAAEVALAQTSAETPMADETAIAEPPEKSEPANEAQPTEPTTTSAPVAQELGPLPEPVLMAEEDETEEWELPTSYAMPQPGASGQTATPPPATQPEASAPVREPAIQDSAPAESGGTGVLGDLAADLASSLEGFATSLDAHPAAPGIAPMSDTPPAAPPSQGVAQLSSLLSEMEESGGAAAVKDDPETNYNLGVAFREMGLLDEAIGEFQKVAKGAGKGSFPRNFLQACSLLAICFMDKKMPAIAVKWYLRALETPSLEEEAQLALQYDLGLAYEQAGDSRKALERYTEVYSQNIDFRDVADKIRVLQQNA